jgi:hypothetical protein
MRFRAAAVNRHTARVAVLVNGAPEAVELPLGADEHLAPKTRVSGSQLVAPEAVGVGPSTTQLPSQMVSSLTSMPHAAKISVMSRRIKLEQQDTQSAEVMISAEQRSPSC